MTFRKRRVEEIEDGLDERVVGMLRWRESEVDDVDSGREGSERSDNDVCRFRRRKKRFLGEERSGEGDLWRVVGIGSDDGRG